LGIEFQSKKTGAHQSQKRGIDVTIEDLLDTLKFRQFDLETYERQPTKQTYSLDFISKSLVSSDRSQKLNGFSALVSTLSYDPQIPDIKGELVVNKVPLQSFWNALGSAGTSQVRVFGFYD
jgi:hypothetical protein